MPGIVLNRGEDVRNNVLHDGTGQPMLDTLAADSDVSTGPQAASPERARKPVPAANTMFPMQMYAQKAARAVHGKPGRIMPQPVDIVIASEDRERYASLTTIRSSLSAKSLSARSASMWIPGRMPMSGGFSTAASYPRGRRAG